MKTRRPFLRRRDQNTATRSTAPFVERVRSYFFLHAHTALASLGRLHAAPFGSGMTILVIAIALALPASFQVLVKNAQRAESDLETTNVISVYLKPGVGNDAARKIADKLRGQPQIAEAKLITKEAGLKEFQQYSGFGEALQALDFNPLPAVITIRPKDSLIAAEDVEKLLKELRSVPEADFVQADTEWMNKLKAILAIAERSVGVLSVLLGIAVLLIVGNTIRLELQHRHEEIVVAKLMGAGDGFIRRPFLYTGLWYGLLGGIGAWLLVTIMLFFVAGPVGDLVRLYGGQFELQSLDWLETGRLIVYSGGLGAAGSLAVVIYHLRSLAPRHY